MILAVADGVLLVVGLAVLFFGLWLYVMDPDTPRVRYRATRGYCRGCDDDCDCDDTL